MTDTKFYSLISIVQLTAIIILIVLVWTRTSSTTTPADVYEKLLSMDGAAIVAVPDRWRKSDHEKWEAEFFRANPKLIRPIAPIDN